MTSEERLDRIEHVTAAIAEDRRKDREEYKMLWRDTQRKIDELAAMEVETRKNLDQLALRLREQGDEFAARIRQQGDEFRAADKVLADRISAVVSAMGQFIARQQ